MDFEFVFIYRHIYRKWVLSVDSKCRNTVILTGLTYTSHQKFNKNRLSLAHCALNRSFTVIELGLNGWVLTVLFCILCRVK